LAAAVAGVSHRVTELVHFSSDPTAFERANRLYDAVASELNNHVPWAEIQHVGGTAVPGSLTKGDLDVVVRVEAARFIEADAILAKQYERNLESEGTDSFSAFLDPDSVPPLGVQLVVVGSESDTFHDWVSRLRDDEALRREYDDLKRRFEGKPMADYREAKSAFIEARCDG